ncbi:uncharacterized protein LOC8023680 [Ixodes scapularis]|uniref:uncharacterized protein LOC8023680 n=1 Tax=Ixodes scapularis TaxID=6945 RepID=UPI001C38D6FC|nr:uncharacterized protein LOC8023680 [Ixodes scapularis]
MKSQDMEPLLKPFEYGFKRELVYRATTNQKVSADVYYYDGAGLKMRSIPDVVTYLGKHPEIDLAAANFSFRRVTIHKPPHEVVRQAKAGVRTAPATPPSCPKQEGKRNSRKRCFCCDAENAAPCRKRLKLRKGSGLAGPRFRNVAGKKTPDCQGSAQPADVSLNGSKDDRGSDSVITTAVPTATPAKKPFIKTTAKPSLSTVSPVKQPKQNCIRVVSSTVKIKQPLSTFKKKDVGEPCSSSLPTSGSALRTYSKVLNACDLLEGPVLKELDEPATVSPKGVPTTIVKVTPAHRHDMELPHHQQKLPKDRWKLGNQSLLRTGASLELCNLHCAQAKGQFPSLQCPKCLCLFHPVCVKGDDGEGFVCKACQKKEGVPSSKLGSVATIVKTAAVKPELSIPASAVQAPSTASTPGAVFGTVLTTQGSPRAFPAIMSGSVLSVPSMASSPSPSVFSVPPSPLVNAPYAQLIGPFPASAPVRFTIITPGSSVPIHIPLPSSSPTIFLSASTTMPSAIVSSATTPSAMVSSAAMPSVVASCATASSAMKFVTTPTAMTRATAPSPMKFVTTPSALTSATVPCPTKFVTTPSALTRATAPSAVELVTMPSAMTPSAVSHSAGLSGTVPSAPVSSAGSSAVAVTVQTASSPSAGSNGPAHLHPASMGLMSLLVRPSCPNITIVPGRFPAAMCGGQMLPLASSSDAARTALLSLVQQLNQRPSATLQPTMMPASGDAPPGSDLVIDMDEKPVCQGVVKHEDKAVESSIVCTYATDGSGSVVSTSTVSCPLPLVDIDSLKTDRQQTCTHSNGTSFPDRSSSRTNVDEIAQDERKSPSILEIMLKNSDDDEERPGVTKCESDLSSVETSTLASDVEKPTVSVSATTSDGCLNRDSRSKNSDQKREPSRCRKLSLRERAASRLLQGLSRLCEPPNGAAARMHMKKPRHTATLPEVAAPLSDSEFDGADGTEDASAQERCNSRLGGVATASEVPGKAGELPFWVVTPTSTVCVGSEVCPVPAESVRQAGNRGGSGSASLAGVSFGPSVLNRIFSFLPVAALCRVATVCWGWNLLSKHPNLWGQVDLRGVNVTDWDTCTLVLQQRQTHTLVVKGSSSSHLVPWVKRLDWVQSLSLYGGSLADLATLVKLFPQMTSLNAVQLTRPQQCRGDDARRESVLLGELQALVGMPRLRSLRLSSMGGLLLCPWAVPKESGEQRFLALRTLSMTTLRCSSLEAFVSLKCLPHLEDLELGDCASWTNQSYLELGQLPKLKCLSLIRGQDQPCFRYVLLKLVHLEVLRLKRWTFRGSIGQLLAQLPRLRQLLLWPQARDLATNNVHALRSCLGLSTLQRLSWVIDCGGSVSCSLASGLEIPVASGRLCDCKASQLLSSQADNPCGCRLLEESLEGEEGTSMRWLTAGQLSGILARSLGAGTAVCVSLRVGF